MWLGEHLPWRKQGGGARAAPSSSSPPAGLWSEAIMMFLWPFVTAKLCDTRAEEAGGSFLSKWGLCLGQVTAEVTTVGASRCLPSPAPLPDGMERPRLAFVSARVCGAPGTGLSWKGVSGSDPAGVRGSEARGQGILALGGIKSLLFCRPEHTSRRAADLLSSARGPGPSPHWRADSRPQRAASLLRQSPEQGWKPASGLGQQAWVTTWTRVAASTRCLDF